MAPPLHIITVTRASDRRATPDLLTLQLLSPQTFLNNTGERHFGYCWPADEVLIVNFRFGAPQHCLSVRCNGKAISFKRRPELRFPWAYGAPRTPQGAYGHFVSLDGETWDTSGYNYAPYRILSILPASERRAIARTAKKAEKGAK